MNVKLIGRKKELEALREYISSNKSEFVAVYGRRRVGKHFLSVRWQRTTLLFM